jgi:hypothetical protein
LTGYTQSRVIPGYFTNNKGDTVSGFIHKKSLRNGSSLCRFKANTASQYQNFQPIEIRSYGTDSMLFETRKEFLRKERKVSPSEFYKVIFDGKLDILVGKSNQYFIGTDTSQLIYYLNRKDMLYYLTGDQPELKSQIKELKFSQSRLAQLMTIYHNSLGLSDYNIYLPSNSAAYLNVFLIAGYNVSMLKTPSESGSYINYSPSYSPVFGYGIDYYPSLRSGGGAFSINLQNRFLKELFQYQVIDKYGTATVYNDVLFEGTVLEVPLGLKFQRRLRNDYKIYVMPGPIWKKYIPQTARVITDVVVSDEVTTTVTDVDYYGQSTISFFLTLGVEKKISNKNKLFVDLNLDHAGSNTFQRYSFSISAGYKFLNYKFDE